MTKTPYLAAPRRVAVAVMAWMAISAAYLPATAPAAPPDQRRPSRDDATTDDAPDILPDLNERLLLSRSEDVAESPSAASDFSLNDESVLRAFRGVVARPAKSTVRILRNGQQVALGCIVDGDGFIATKGSELGGPVTCELADGTQYAAELVGIDHGSDLALLKIHARGLPVIRWSDDDPPSVGGWVVTPGTGVLPRAIGIVSVAPHRVRGGVLGVQLAEDQPGPRITNVVPHSGAADAGLSRGDIVTHIDGRPIENSEAMVATTSAMLPGEEIKLTILRNGKREPVTAVLGSVSDTLSSERARFQNQLGASLSERRFLFPSVLEHDSALERTECGGALVNLGGETIGINIARANRVASFAIPARVARPLLESLKQRGTVPVSGQADNRRSVSASDGS